MSFLVYMFAVSKKETLWLLLMGELTPEFSTVEACLTAAFALDTISLLTRLFGVRVSGESVD